MGQLVISKQTTCNVDGCQLVDSLAEKGSECSMASKSPGQLACLIVKVTERTPEFQNGNMHECPNGDVCMDAFKPQHAAIKTSFQHHAGPGQTRMWK